MESQIEKLQQKYWEGKTTVEEEKILKSNLKKESLKSKDKMYFSELEDRKTAKIDIQFTPPRTRSMLLWKISSLAAAILILIAFAINFNDFNKNEQFVVDNPQQAYEISQQALMLVSAQLNKGKTYTTQVGKINDVKQIVNKY